MTPLSAFVGRDDVQERLRDLTDERRLVTVTGPGGVGKTRLVQHAIGEAAIVVELSPLGTTGDVGAEAAAQFGHGSLEEWAMTVADQAATVVLDNCEHVLDGAASLATTLLDAGPHVRVVATSREPLALDGEQLLVLEPLSEDAAIELFVDRARAVGVEVDAHDPTVVALCRRLDGLPLAVELAASRARTMTPAELLDHLDQRFELLSGLAVAIAVSYDLLDDDEQRAFRRLASLPGPFTVEVAHQLTGSGSTSTLATVDLLAGFVDRSLVVTTTSGTATRYHLLDSLRDYGRAQLEERGEVETTGDDVVDAMVAECDRTIDLSARSWSMAVLRLLLDQFASYVVALEWCLAHDESPDRAHTMLAVMWGGIHNARFREVAALGRRVLDRWEDGADHARAEAVVANALLLDGDVDGAVLHASNALTDTDLSEFGRIVAHRTLALGCRYRGDLDRSAEEFAAAREVAMALHASPFVREIGVFEASVLGRAGNTDKAIADLTTLAIAAEAHDEIAVATWARIEAANQHLLEERPTEARPLLVAALDGGLMAPIPWAVSASRRLLAVIVTQDKGWEAAGEAWRDAIEAAVIGGEANELVETVRTAAGAARAAGADGVADSLWSLVPSERPVASLPSLFPDEASGVAQPPVGLLRAVSIHLTGTAPSEVATTTARGSFVRDGDGWQIAYAGRRSHVTHRKGLDDLAQLLVHPNKELHCLELMGAADTGDAGPALDDQARRAYQQRVRDLQQEIDEASDHNDPVRAERAELELDALVEELSASLGLGGKARSEKSAAERARSAVTWRIRAAVRHLEGSAPELARHLQNAVRTGTWCTYRPETAVDWEVRR